MLRVLLMSLAIVIPTAAVAAQCTAKITAVAHAQESPATMLKPGTKWGPPTQLVLDPVKKAAFVCAHGDYCYEAAGIQLNGCHVVPLPPVGKEDPSDPIIFGLQ